jgi:hypothetical protein
MSLIKDQREKIYFAQSTRKTLTPRQVKRITKKHRRAQKAQKEAA